MQPAWLFLNPSHVTAVVVWIFILANPAGALDEPRDSQQSSETAFSKPIRVDLNVYTPGTIPSGIGKPVQQAARLAEEWEALHPGKKIRFQPVVATGGGEGEWLKTQLLGGIAPEILHQNAEIAWQDTDKNWYVALDDFLEKPNPYIAGNKRWIDAFSNQELVMTKRAPDGKLYCISIDIVETGLYYNKDLLHKLGFDSMPATWAEMLSMFRKIKGQGVTPMATALGGLGSDWGQDIIFEMLYHDILPLMDVVPSTADTSNFLVHFLEPPEAGFLASKGFFSSRDPRWREMNRLVYEWRQFWPKELKNSDPMRLFLTGRVPIFWDSSYQIRRLATDPYIDFDWGVAYIPTLTSETSRFAKGTPATVIGGAAMQLHVTNSAILNHNLDDCIDFLMWLSTPHGIERLASEALIFIPNIKGAKMAPELEPFYEIFQRRCCAIQFLESLDGQYKKQWRRMLDYYLNDGIDLDGYLKILDKNFQDWVASHRHEAAWDFTQMERVWNQRKDQLLAELDPVSP
jgi:ABC-type glycerol-3-phosphate transport system substrate-binding protein